MLSVLNNTLFFALTFLISHVTLVTNSPLKVQLIFIALTALNVLFGRACTIVSAMQFIIITIPLEIYHAVISESQFYILPFHLSLLTRTIFHRFSFPLSQRKHAFNSYNANIMLLSRTDGCITVHIRQKLYTLTIFHSRKSRSRFIKAVSLSYVPCLITM